MSFGTGDESHISRPGELLASEANREAVQAVLKKAYEDQRLTLDEFEARVGRAVAARTLSQLAELTRDLPAEPVAPPAPSTRRRTWLVGAGIAVVAGAQASRLRAAIGRDDPGRIRIAALTPATVRSGGGERALTNAIASCPADSPGVTLVTTTTATYLVTSYASDQPTTQAVGAALNVHASLASGLMDAVRRMTLLDPRSS